MSALLQLAERCEKAAGPNYALECEIWDAVYPGERDERFKKLTSDGPYKGRLGPADRDGYIKPLAAFTASIDAAMRLVPEGMRDEIEITTLYQVARVGINLNHSPDDGPHYGSNESNSIALALCAAALRARAAS